MHYWSGIFYHYPSRYISMQLAVYPKLFINFIFSSFITVILLVSTVMANENTLKIANTENLIESHEFDEAVSRVQDTKNHYLHELINKATALELQAHPVWRTLLHYKTSIMYNSLSQVDGWDYFNSQNGKTSSKAELMATLASFFATTKIKGIDMTPQCRFPARFFWLNKQLNFDKTKLAQQDCEKFKYFAQALNTDALTVVFPSSHPNSPSSMFGHTLLRFDKKGQTKKTRMLAYSANYAAQGNSNNDLLYAYKGLTGGFIGKFSIIPYYMKLREYSQMESRDIWEYQLNLAPSDVDFIVMHAFELEITHFDYYFFTENCSYHLLSLIEVAIPELKLTDQFKGAVIPINTVKLLDELKLISKKEYYPSNRLIINNRQKNMPKEKYSLAIEISKDVNKVNSKELLKYDKVEQAEIIDMAYDLNRFNKIQSTGELDAKINKSQRKLLLSRSSLKIKSQPIKIKEPNTYPDEGHDTTRITLGGGRLDQGNYGSFGLRLAYHGILDPAEGYSPNSQIQFFNLKARYHTSTSSYQLTQLDLIDILSLEPRDNFFKDISWRINTGISSRSKKTTASNLIYTVNGGPGLTYKLNFLDNMYVYSFFESELNHSQIYETQLQALMGVSAGFLTNITGYWKVHAHAKFLGLIHNRDTNNPNLYTATLEQGFSIAKNISIHLKLSQIKHYDGKNNIMEAGLNYYF